MSRVLDHNKFNTKHSLMSLYRQNIVKPDNKHQSARTLQLYVRLCTRTVTRNKSASGETSGSNRHYNENKYMYKYSTVYTSAKRVES